MICNLACSYCYLGDRKEAKGTVPLLALETWLEVRAQAGTKLFAFIGKEPLADGRATRLIERLNTVRRAGQKRFRTGMVTNGTLVSRWIDRLAEADLSYIDVSLDGMTDDANRLRGDDVAMRAMAGVDAIINSPLRDRFATATVLTAASSPGYADFVREMFARGAPTCFASPVLRFAMSNDVADYALTLEEVWLLVEELAAIQPSEPGGQIIIDLPYRYTWSLLASGRVPISEVREDAFEALFWAPAGSAVHIKLNPFPYSFWRALRVTHDGRTILNMDLAAHPEYQAGAPDFRGIDGSIFSETMLTGVRAMTNFIEGHVTPVSKDVFERDLRGQFARHVDLLTA